MVIAVHCLALLHVCGLADWYDYRFCDNVLWLHFEDLKQDLRGCVKLIAKFLELDWQDEKLIDLVTKQARPPFPVSLFDCVSSRIFLS